MALAWIFPARGRAFQRGACRRLEDPMSMNRRHFVRGAAVALGGALAAPSVVKAQTRELVIGGPGSFGTLLKQHFFARFEKSHQAKVFFEGSVSLTHLEKMRANKARQSYSIVMMDDPVMVIADSEGLLARITPTNVPSSTRIDPTAIHRGGAWVNYQAAPATIAYHTKHLPKGIPSWAEAWDPKYKGRVVIPSLRSTEGVLTLIMASHLETGLPFDKALLNIDAGFKRVAQLKPNLLTIYANSTQGFQLLEQGEAALILSAPAQPVAARKAAGVPIDVVANPKEGAFAMPNGIALVKDGPNADLAAQLIDAFLSEEYQSLLAGVLNTNPVNLKATVPDGFTRATNLFRPDWAYIAEKRAAWTDRWSREIAG
jgi:putative spermidine/putrescine transport system substrate-binding protein